MAERIIRCRVLGKHSNPCTGEAVDPDGELLICERHLAAALRIFNERMAALGAPAARRRAG